MGSGEMPKEVIKGKFGDFSVHIGWFPDHEVQVGVVLNEPSTSDAPQNLKELTQKPEWLDDHMGIFSSLDRYQINKMIRVLRRARDSAYGKDE